MNAFDAANEVEARARARLLPFIEQRADEGRYVLTNKGRLAPLLQEIVGDVIMNSDGNVVSIEMKAEERHTKNLFIETWSNRNLENDSSYAIRGSNLGWIYKTRADLIFYYFLDIDVLYVIPTLSLKRWAFGWGETAARLYEFDERKQRRFNQLNDTWGRVVPVKTLFEEMAVKPKWFRVAQLELRLQEEAMA
jgi:hypothetical protein